MAKRKGSVTIRHVADDAGVSHQTVSRVINKQPNVRPAVKEKVLRSIEKLGYVPSIAAQRMGGSRSYLILALNDRARTIEDWQLRQGTDWIDQMLYGAVMGGSRRGTGWSSNWSTPTPTTSSAKSRQHSRRCRPMV